MRYNSSEGDTHEFVVDDENVGVRLDVYLSACMPGQSRSFIKRLIDDSLVQVEPGKVKPAYKLRGGEKVTLFLPELIEMSAEPEDIPIDVLHEDESIVVLNKQPFLAVHPSPGHETGTLVNALLHHCEDLSGIGGVLRPGIVHRLDMNTSGCIVIAKNDQAHQELAAQFAARETSKTYLAITVGSPRPAEGKVEGQIGRHPVHRQRQAMLDEGGRYSLTFYKMLEDFGKHALVECDIKTGRTHQIRVHLKHVHAPILCDSDYGKGGIFKDSSGRQLLSRQALHACRLAFRHPVTNERMEFCAPLQKDMQSALDFLRSGADSH